MTRTSGGGGRFDYAYFTDEIIQDYARRAVHQAVTNLAARPAPAGTMTVVLGPGWPGVLLHEAVGHGLEGDFNRKGSSVFSGRIGERVAAPGVTVIDDGTIADHGHVSRDTPAALAAWLLPGALLERSLRQANKTKLDDLATVIFSSGSTATPKGIMLSHHNILANIEGIAQVIRFTPSDRIMGVLPLFHSFGFTVTLWAVLSLGFKGVYHFNPLDARTVGALCRDHQVSVLLGTPTFMRAYLKKCGREAFASLRLPILGAEKLKLELARDIQETLGIEPLEGYGCTETAPVVAVNVPHQPLGRSVPGLRLGHDEDVVLARDLPELLGLLSRNVDGALAGERGVVQVQHLVVERLERALGERDQPDRDREARQPGGGLDQVVQVLEVDLDVPALPDAPHRGDEPDGGVRLDHRGDPPSWRSTSSMIIVLRSSMSFVRSTLTSLRMASRMREGRDESMIRVVPMATASSSEPS